MLTPEDVKKMKVADLKEECKKRGLSIDGKKQDLVSRLAESIAQAGDAVAAKTVDTPDPSTKAHQQVAQATKTVNEATAPPAQATAAPASVKKSIPIPTVLSDEERKKLRAQKFGVAHLSEEDKKKLRAERFAAPGSSAPPKPSAAAPTAAAAALQKGSGIAKPAKPSKPLDPSQVMSLEELERRKARAAKFGTAPPSLEEEEAAKKLARAKKYGTLDEDTKRKLRAARFTNAAAPAAKPAVIPPPAKKVKPTGEVQ